MVHLTDSHAHMLDAAFDNDREQVFADCFSSTVKSIIEIACEKNEWAPALALCEKYPANIKAVLGVHPGYAEQTEDKDIEKLETLLREKNVLGIGEIGLDYFHTPFSEERQQEILKKMLRLTHAVNKPVVLHIRKSAHEQDYSAYGDTFSFLEQYLKPCSNDFKGVLHCFSGRGRDAAQAIDMGMLIGINGIISYKKNDDLRATVKEIGLENIILETDCPYLPPQSKRGKRNSPLNIPEIAQFTADVLDVSLEKLAAVTTENCRRLFNYNF